MPQDDPLGILTAPSQGGNDPLGILKKKDGGQSSLNGAAISNVVSNSPAPSSSPQQNQPTQPKYVVHADGTTSDYSIPSIAQGIQNQQQNSDGSTNVPHPVVAPSSADIAAKKASVKADNEIAIDNTVKKIVAQKGEYGATGANPVFEKEKLRMQLQNGNVSVGYDKDGNLGLKQQAAGGITGFVGSFIKTREDANKEAADADLFTNGLNNTERIAFLKNKQQQESASPFIDTKQSFGSTIGKLTGSLEQPLENLGKGAIAGAATVATAPATMGASLEGLPLALGIAMGNKDAFNMGYSSEVQRAFGAIKKANPNISDIDAMNEAEKQGNVGGSAGLATNIALMGGSVEGGGSIAKEAISDGAKNIIGKAVAGTAKMAAIPAIGQAATEEAGNLNGVKTSQSDILNDAVQTFKNNLTPAVVLHLIGAGAAGLTKLPKPVENTLKLAATEIPPEQIKATLEGGEKTGFYPAGTAELVTHDINNFKEATDKIPSEIPDEKKAEIVPLIQNKQALVDEQKTKDSSFKDSYQEKIDNVDNQIKQIINKPTEEDVNNNSSQLNTADNGKSSQEANASSKGRQEVNKNEEPTEPVSEVGSSTTKDFTNGRDWEDLSSKEKVEASKEYNKSNPRKSTEDQTNEFIKTLSDNGIDKNDYSISKSSTNYGNSNYFEFHLPEDKPITVRVSDHSVTNPERMKELHYESLKMGDALKMKGDKLSDVINYIKENKESNSSDLYNDNGATKKGKETFKTALEKAQPKSQQEINAIRKEVFGDEGFYNDKLSQSVKGISDAYMGKGVEEKPISDKIQPDDTFRTLDYGEHKGEPESKEKQDQIKQEIIDDKPVGKTGEKFSDFIKRVVPKFKDLIDKEPNNTTVVTHSSVIKALDVWEDMGRPDVESMTDKQKQKFAEKYVKEDIEKEGGVSTFKGEGDNVIHAIRHGETEDNKMSEFREDNTKLTTKGEGQAEKAGQELNKITGGDVPKIISSDLPRAIRTSNIISEQFKSADNSNVEGVGTNDKIQSATNENTGSNEPPTEASVPEKANTGGESTGIKKSITEEERAKRMLPEVKLPKLGSDDEVLQRGKENVDTGKINPRDVVDRVIKEKGIYTPEEAGAMQYYAHQLSKEESNIKDEIESHPVGSPERAGAVNKLGQLSDEIDRMTEANRTNSNSWGKLGNVMQMETDESFNPSLVKTIIKENYAGEVPEDVQKKLDDALKMRDDAIRELKEAKENMAKKSIQRDAELEQRQSKIKQTKEELKNEREDLLLNIQKALKKDLGNINSGIPIPTETLKAIGKLAVNYFKDGVVTIDGLTDKIYNDLRKNGFTKQAIREAISNYNTLRYEAKDKEQAKIENKASATWKKIANGDFVAPKKSDIVFRKSMEYIDAENNLAKAEYRLSKLKKESFESQKNYYQKALDWAGRLVRLSVLSGTNVLYKLASAATIGGAIKRIPEQAFGKMYSMTFKGIAEKAPIEGSFNANAEANFYKEFFNPVKFVKNTAEILKTGESYLGHKFSKGEDHHIPLMYVMTDLHQVIKDPLKRAAYESSFRNAIVHAEKNGYDIKDPLIVNSAENAAYKRAKYEIFQESNALTNAFTSWKNKLEKGEGKLFWQKVENKNAGSTAKFLTDFLIPVSTIPTNIVKRVMSTSPFGLIRGGFKVEEAYRKGLNNLSSDEAESVMRQLKQGTLGTALWLAGWYGYKSFGGLYTPLNPDKKRGGDLGHDQMEVNGQLIPKPVQHAIPLEVVQLAATARRLYEDKKENKEVTFNTLEKTALGSIGALVGDVPIISTPVEAIEASKSDYEAKKFKEDMESRFTPQILRENMPKKKAAYGGGGAGGKY